MRAASLKFHLDGGRLVSPLGSLMIAQLSVNKGERAAALSGLCPTFT